MKKILFYFSLLIFTAACEETNPTKDPNVPDLPETTQIDDVCEAMDDMEFIAYCYENFDVNGDGKVSMDEAKNVRLIAISEKNIYSIKGINYFSNLNEIQASRCRLIEVDLRLNINLKRINFYNCTELESVLLPDEMSEINYRAFCECISLTSIDLPNAIASIGHSAFLACYNLEEVTIGKSITSIGPFAFSSCNNIIRIYCKATKRPECDKTAFGTLPSDLTIYVPRGSAEEYEGWLGCNNIVEYDF